MLNDFIKIVREDKLNKEQTQKDTQTKFKLKHKSADAETSILEQVQEAGSAEWERLKEAGIGGFVGAIASGAYQGLVDTGLGLVDLVNDVIPDDDVENSVPGFLDGIHANLLAKSIEIDKDSEGDPFTARIIGQLGAMIGTGGPLRKLLTKTVSVAVKRTVKKGIKEKGKKTVKGKVSSISADIVAGSVVQQLPAIQQDKKENLNAFLAGYLRKKGGNDVTKENSIYASRLLTAKPSEPVSYTHLTLPTNREV